MAEFKDNGKLYTMRLVWIDWMKTLAMYLIVAGHCWVPGDEYVYVFSVSAFFILSGFLSKREENVRLFWKKVLWNLIVPMVIYFTITSLVQFGVQIMKGSFQLKYLYEAPLLGLAGMQGKDTPAGGLKAMWFVYTLILCKILLQYSPKKHSTLYFIGLNTLLVFTAWCLHQKEIVCYNSYVNVLLAMPFFTIGFYLRTFRNSFSNLSLMWMPVLLIIGIFGVYYCGTYNDIVMLYRCSYGSDLPLCFIGALCGTVILYALSMLLNKCLINTVRIIGGGTFVILGLHFVVIQIINQFVNIQGFWLYVESLLILIAFIPVIRLVEKHIPVLYGKLREEKR